MTPITKSLLLTILANAMLSLGEGLLFVAKHLGAGATRLLDRAQVEIKRVA